MYSSNIKIISVNKENGNYNNENLSESNSYISKIQHHTNFKNHNNNQSQRITKNSITQQHTNKKKINNNITHGSCSHNNSNRKKFLNNNNNTIKIQNIYPTKNILHNIVNIKKSSIDYNNNNNNGANLGNSISYSGKPIKNLSPSRSKNTLIKSNNIKINSNNKNINNNNHSSLNNNIIPQLEVSMVMNSTPSITDQNTTTVNATNSTTTIVPTSVSPAASYSLDFLHSVGVQMTIGGSSCSSSRGYTPTPSPSPPAPRNPTSYINATNLRNRYSYTMQEDVNLTSVAVDNQNLNTNKDFNNYDTTFDHLNGRLPSSSTSSTIRSNNNNNNNIGTPILTSRGLTYNPHQLYQNNNYAQHAHQQHHHHQQQQQSQQQQQQHQNQYYVNHQQPPHHPSQYQGINNGLHYNNNNARNHHPHHQAKKSTQNTFNNTQNNNLKKTYSNNSNKYGNSLTAAGLNDINNNNSLQTLPRNRNHQNFNNLTYVLTDGGKFVSNSRSPTPSPKSESPLIFRQQNLNENLSTNSSGIIPSTVSYDPLENSSISTAVSTTLEKSSNSGGISFAGGATTTHDYESDSSHSSYRHNNEKSFLSINNNNNNINNNNNSNSNSNINNNNGTNTNNNNNNNSNNNNTNNNNRQIIGAGAYHLGEINSIISFSPAYSEEDIFKTHGNYYGSHQNLTYWNVGINPPFSPYGVYSPNNIASSDINNQYVNDTGTVVSNIKRSQSAQRGTFRGRRHLFPSFRAHSFHENIYTPPDKFLARAHLIEIKEPPQTLLNGTKWDSLTQDIWNKFMGSQQTEETYKKKMYLWRYLYVTIKKAYPRYGLYLVGSTISGFGADTSDVDMCLVSRNATSIDPRMEALFNLTLLKEYLGTLGVFENFNLIEAKVPILRFRDSMHMLEVDLNFNNCVGIRNTHLLHCYSQLDWRLKPLVLITKLWAQFHNINNAKNMTISSYSLVLMVIHFLQYAISPPVLPCLHEMFPEKFQIILKSNDFGFVDMNEDIGHYESQNNQPLGELLLLYLEYYSNFDYTQYAISVRTGAVLPIDVCRQAKSLKNDIHQWKELCIEEPFDLTNTARSVYDFDTFERIKAVFIASWKVLHETLDMNSIFSPILQSSIPLVPLSMAPPIS